MQRYAAPSRVLAPRMWWGLPRLPGVLVLLHSDQGDRSDPERASARATPHAESVDVREFEAFFRTHEPSISSYLYRMLGDTASASDLSQETFFRAWRHFSQIREYERPQAWLFRVATNLALQHLRSRSIRSGFAHVLDERFEPSESDPGRRFALRDLVRESLLELPPRPRALLVLREAYGFTADEAAKALGMSLTAAKVALWRARTQFRTVYLSKDGQE